MSLPFTAERFGNKIRLLRQEHNWTLTQLAEITGINENYLNKIEKGTAKRLKISHLEIFTKCFNINLEEILTLTE